MRTLSVQFQPGRAVSANVASVVSLMSRIAGGDASLRSFGYQKGRDRGPYVNFQFEVPVGRLVQTWAAISARALSNRLLGAALRQSCIVTCEGTRGWDNYLLLYHFDHKHKLDAL